MAECTIKKGGGGGVSSDEVTVTADKVLAGCTYVGADTNDEIGTGTMAVQSAISFSAAAQSTSVIRISWKNPSVGPWTGVKIRMSTSGYPGVSGGTLKYTGTGSSTTPGGTSYVDISGLEVGTTCYFTCYSYVTGLGDSTTGYNVSAKTKGLLAYAYGVQYVPLEFRDKNGANSAMQFNADHLNFWRVTLAGNFQLGVKLGEMSLVPYTKLCVDCSITLCDYKYLVMRVRYGENTTDFPSKSIANSTYVGSPSDTRLAANIDACDYTWNGLNILLGSWETSTGGGSRGVNGKIYKIWLE